MPLILSILIAAGLFLTGIDWGLPTRASDAVQFGTREPWSGAILQTLIEGPAGGRWNDPNRGADVDADPIARPPGQLVRLNPAVDPEHLDQKPIAEIVRRYRLFSHQPDEMITFMSLSKMKPGAWDFDPRLYQYGGLWIYPVGFCLKAAAAIRFVDLSGSATGPGFFLDHPEAFGRFYIVARLYTVAWGLIGIWAVFTIVRRIGCLPWVAGCAAIAVACMPVVLNMAHEAKPHLPGMVLVLLAVLAGAQYVENGRLSYSIVAGGLCGAAVSMVLSTAPVFAILPLMVLLRRAAARGFAANTGADSESAYVASLISLSDWGNLIRSGIFSCVVGLVVYGLFNPYVVYHVLRQDGGLSSNLSNSSSFYTVGRPFEGLLNVGWLIYLGMGPAAILAFLAAIWLGIRALHLRTDQRPHAVRRRALGLLLAAPAILTAVQAVMVAAGKPGEFARFLLLTDVFLLIELVVMVYDPSAGGPPQRTWTKGNSIIGVLFILCVGYGGVSYAIGFVRDGASDDSRRVASAQIEYHRQQGAKRLLLTVEPAPWGVPPSNWFDWPVLLVPKGESPDAYAQSGDVIVQFRRGPNADQLGAKAVSRSGEFRNAFVAGKPESFSLC